MNWIVPILALVSPLTTAAGPSDGPAMRMCVSVGSHSTFQDPDRELKEVLRQLPAAQVWFARQFRSDVVELASEGCPIRAELRGYVKTALGRTVEIHFFLGDSGQGMKRVLAGPSPRETARNVIPYLEQFVWEVRLSTSPERPSSIAGLQRASGRPS